MTCVHGIRQLSTMPNGSWPSWASVLNGLGSRSIPTRHASSTSAPTETRTAAPSGYGWHLVRLPRLYPCLGQVTERQEHGAAGDGQKPIRPCAGSGDRMVPEQPASSDPRAACRLAAMMRGHYRLLRHWLATVDDCAGTPGRSCGHGRSGFRGESATGLSCGTASRSC